MARILFVAGYYPPEIGAAQTQNRETAVRLAQRGHEVTVLTTLPNYPTGIVPPEYRHGQRRREIIDGVKVVRVWSYASPNKGFLRRILAMLSFGCLAGFLGVREVGHPDLIVVVSPPLFTAIAGRMLAWRKRCPYVFNVHDIWPESAIQLGVLRNRLMIRLSEWLEWSTYHGAAAVWAVTQGIQQTLVGRGVPADKVFMLPIGVDIEKFRPLPAPEARGHLGWDERFTVLYAGTIGLAHGLQTLLDAADRLRDHPSVRVVLIGDGAARADLMAEAERRGLHNVTFLGPQPHDQMPLYIAAADACLVPLRQLPLFQGALPSKMYEFMACERPILLAVDGEARALAERDAGAALYVEPENPTALAEAILSLKERPDVARRLGQQGRAFVCAHFDRDHLVGTLEERLVALLPVRQSAIAHGMMEPSAHDLSAAAPDRPWR
jgi:glycosyltransferase involved in cell wall biosynthesis